MQGQWTDVDDMNAFVTFAMEHYRIDTSRMYMTGLSMGAGRVWEYASTSPEYAKQIAAIVPMSPSTNPTERRAKIIADANVHVWAFHCDDDNLVPSSNSKNYVQWVNQYNPGLAKITLYPGKTHDSWSRGYNPARREDNMNVYQWMLQYKREAQNP
jgi:predicted peptidase